MKTILRQFCTCSGCRGKLTSFWAAYLGLCSKHYEVVNDDDYWIGLCYKCGSITAIGPREEYINKEKIFIKDKYIFSKGCMQCTGDVKMNISWMTIKDDSPSSTYVTPEGKFVSDTLSHRIVPPPGLDELKSGSQRFIFNPDVTFGFDWDE